MDLRGYVRAIRKSWWVVLLAVVIGAGAAALLVLRATPVYAAKITFYVSTPLVGDNSSLQATDQFAQDRANSYAELLSSERLGAMVVKTAKLDLAPGQVASKVSGVAKLNTVMVVATVRDTSPGRALKISDAVAQDMPKLVDQLDAATSSSARPPVSLHVVSGPSVGAAPVSPRKKLDIIFGMAIGLIVGLAIAVLRELFDTAVRSADDLTEASGRPVLGEIGFDPAARRTPLIIDEDHGGRRSEDFRQLRTNLQFLDAAERLRVVVVTSSLEGEGKSTTAANLGVVMAEAGTRVALVEADLRRPKLSSYLGLERASGLTSVLSRQAEVSDVLQPWGRNGLKVLASGPLPPNPSELLGSERMAELLGAMQELFDVIIIDAPPLLPVTDAAVLSTYGAGVVLVVRHGKTKQGPLRAALAALETVNARVLGTVLSMRPTKGVDAGYYAAAYYPPSEPTLTLDAEAARGAAHELNPKTSGGAGSNDGNALRRGRWLHRNRVRADRVTTPQAPGGARKSVGDDRTPADHVPEALEPAKNTAER